jgi:hypothetical protein
MSNRQLVRFAEEEQKQIIEYGKQIYLNKLKRRTAKQPVSKRYAPVWIDIFGEAGCIAVHKFIGKPYKFELFDQVDAGWDISTRYNLIEVKTNLTKDCNLLRVPSWQINKQSTMYVCVNKIYKLECFEILGFINASQFKQIMFSQQFKGYEDKPMYCCHKTDLEPPEWLRINYINGNL